jgi:hypothetical protein
MRKTMRKVANPARPEPVSLAPLSFEDALKALVATPSMAEKPKRRAVTRRKKSPRQKAT